MLSQQLLKLPPSRLLPYVGCGNTYIGLGEETNEDLTAAQADYKQAVELEETNVDACLGQPM